MRLPRLSATAKAQAWGMCVGGATAFYATYVAQFGFGVFLAGWLMAWIAGEMLFGKRLIGVSDAKSIALAVASGMAFPWAGFALAALTHR